MYRVFSLNLGTVICVHFMVWETSRLTGFKIVGYTSNNLHLPLHVLAMIVSQSGLSTKSKRPTCLPSTNINR